MLIDVIKHPISSWRRWAYAEGVESGEPLDEKQDLANRFDAAVGRMEQNLRVMQNLTARLNRKRVDDDHMVGAGQ